MTEDEKELEQKIKQYQYEQEEAEKKLKQLENDMHKGKKKSFIFKINRTAGKIVFVWAGIGFIILGFLLIHALANLISALNTFDIVKEVESKYNIKLEVISREAGDKSIVYQVKPKKFKYRKIQFTILKEGMEYTDDDFPDKYLKYLTEKIKQKGLLQDFETQEKYDEKGLMEYKIIYSGNNDADISNKIQELKNNYIKYDKKFEKIINLEKIIIIKNTI